MGLFGARSARGAVGALVVFLSLSTSSWGYSPPDDALPDFTFVGPTSQLEREAAVRYRAQMIQAFEHWKRAGLDKTPRIEALIYIPSWDGVRIHEVLSVFNPSIPDVVAHIEAQHQHFAQSDLFRLLTYLEKKADLPKGMLTTKFFDKFANLRYGYSIPGFYEAVKNNAQLDQLKVDSDLARPTDNAYYGRFPKIDLTKSLPLSDPDGKLTAIFLTFLTDRVDSISLYRMTDMSNEGMSQRIVILPRLGEERGTLERSTLNDPSVGVHEFGHHINATQGETPRVVDEAMADNIWFALTGEPKIGVGFAAVSGKIAEDLAKSSDFGDQLNAGQLAELAAQGSLRDLSLAVTIDEISRYHSIADNYSGGDPIRTFLYRLRQNPKIPHDKLDQVALSAIAEMAHIPLHVSEQASVAIDLRQLLLEMRKMRVVKKIYDDILTRMGDLSKEEDLAVRVVAFQLATKNVKQREERGAKRRMERIRAGGRESRPMTVFDYILPEYFRAFFRASEDLGFKDLSDLFAEEAARVMNSTARILTLRGGKRQVVFVRYPDSIPDASVEQKISATLNRVDSLGKEWIDAAVAWMIIDDDQRDSPSRREMERVEEAYLETLSRIQEFERTGIPNKLDNPWPNHHRLKQLVEKINTACQTELIRVSEDDGAIAFHPPAE